MEVGSDLSVLRGKCEAGRSGEAAAVLRLDVCGQGGAEETEPDSESI